MTRTATCHCGQLQIECEGDPDPVVMCHCEHCQRRTGTSYNLAAWFERSRTKHSGEAALYRRTGDGGFEIIFRFCPTCGTSLWWEVPAFKEHGLAVAVGCFADPEFPAPSVSIYGKRRHAWLPPIAGIPSYAEVAGSEEESGAGSGLDP